VKTAPSLPVPDKKRKRASFFQNGFRWWFRAPDGSIVRGLHMSFYEPCYYGGFPRELHMLLPVNDPRPLGVRLYNKKKHKPAAAFLQSTADHYRAHSPVGQWVEWIYPAQKEAA
jgi:hypothetical protein